MLKYFFDLPDFKIPLTIAWCKTEWIKTRPGIYIGFHPEQSIIEQWMRDVFIRPPNYITLLKTNVGEDVPMHPDPTRNVVVNYVIQGYGESKLDFGNRELTETYATWTGRQALINVKELHKPIATTEDRAVISMCWNKPTVYEEILALAQANELLK
jgi:hypothetical protein